MECSLSRILAIRAALRRWIRHFVSRCSDRSIALHPKINLWQAWLGFNLSHSLGLLMFGGAFLYVGIRHSSLFSQSVLLQGCAILISAAYLVMSLQFWYSRPAIAWGIAMACFVLAAALSHA